MKKKRSSKNIHFRANAVDQKRLAELKKRFETNNSGTIRLALRHLLEKEGGK